MISAYEAGCTCFVALGVDDPSMPEEKRAEQQQRDRRTKTTSANDPDRYLSHDHAPSNWCDALSDRGFKQQVLRYLHDELKPPEAVRDRHVRVTLITRFGSCGARVFCRAAEDDACHSDDSTDAARVTNDGEADLAAARSIEWLASTASHRTFVVRTIDSDSLPILLAAQARLQAYDVTIYLWLPACERKVRSPRSTYRYVMSSSLIAAELNA
ncbi:hypothetical protein CYMTET_11496 [Cymbomonas tetramitiformis]|uniref:Uncharacterized protein n=1 Tax=Cymbomonas tetramitiformis TaxID=36881 RepID=A0AAE0GM74_9CHLO|nr:hypothetical protein CYMTET_11496 [Cymbomonas tetramitiformis]